MTDITATEAPSWRKVVSMTSLASSRLLLRARTGGPGEDRGPQLLQQVLGWTLVVLLAVLVTRAGLM